MIRQPSIELWGVVVQEPTTTFSDVILALLCFYFYWLIGRRLPAIRAIRFQRYYFLFFGLGTLAGGILGHGFNYGFLDSMKLPGWSLSMIAAQWLAYGVLEELREYWPKGRYVQVVWMHTIIGLGCLVFFLFSWNFLIPKLHAAYTMIGIVGLGHYFLFRMHGNRRSILYVLGVLPLIAMAFVFAQKWSISVWFNQNDISHVLMGMASWAFFVGLMRWNSMPALQRRRVISKG
ncbi:MAG: hypothetical protein AAGH79_19255 [Bacteroidota bacterium]